MAFATLNNVLIEVGKAIKKEIFQTLKDNQDDLQARLSIIEAGTSKVVIFNFPVFNAASASKFTGLTYWRVPFDFSLLDAKIGIYTKGALVGTLEMDIQKGATRDPAGMSSVFTTLPSLVMAAAADYEDSANAVLDAGQQDLSTGDFLRFDITQLPTPVIGAFQIFLIGEIS